LESGNHRRKEPFLCEEQKKVKKRCNNSNPLLEGYDYWKGGEILHFHYLLISLVVMVGATIFLPDNAFAEKNELNGTQHSQKASVQPNAQVETGNTVVQPNTPVKTGNTAVQANVPAKAENAKSLMKTAEVQKPAQAGEKQQPAKITLPQAASDKPAPASQNLPDQAKGNGRSAIIKTEKAVNPATEKAAAVKESKSRSEKNKSTAKNAALHQTDTDVENRTQPWKLVNKVETQGEGSRLSLSKKEAQFEPLVLESQKKGQVPVSKDAIPNVNQVMNPTQRSNSSGGQSNDRVSSGLSTISLLDKWFDFNKHYEVKLIRSYFSRKVLFNNQWVNAPPLPPPQDLLY
jgi:hypothetical protein